MILRRFVGQSASEALAAAERSFGGSALVVETRRRGDAVVLVAARPLPPRSPRPRRDATLTGLQELCERGRRRGLSEAILETMSRALEGLAVELERPGDPALHGMACRVLAALIPTTDVWSLPRVVALVGPTGTGKTTTIAKLAAAAVSDRGERVALCTMDLRRAGAVEQLRHAADRIGAPLEVLFGKTDLHRALHGHRDKDRIWIDTAGCGPRDAAARRELQAAFAGVPLATLCCLTAATRRNDLTLCTDSYAPLLPSGCIATKLDETDAAGELVSHCIETGLPLALLTDGQEIPDDFRLAAAPDLAHLLLQPAP